MALFQVHKAQTAVIAFKTDIYFYPASIFRDPSQAVFPRLITIIFYFPAHRFVSCLFFLHLIILERVKNFYYDWAIQCRFALSRIVTFDQEAELSFLTREIQKKQKNNFSR